jgi:hypothetical protein
VVARGGQILTRQWTLRRVARVYPARLTATSDSAMVARPDNHCRARVSHVKRMAVRSNAHAPRAPDADGHPARALNSST